MSRAWKIRDGTTPVPAWLLHGKHGRNLHCRCCHPFPPSPHHCTASATPFLPLPTATPPSELVAGSPHGLRGWWRRGCLLLPLIPVGVAATGDKRSCLGVGAIVPARPDPGLPWPDTVWPLSGVRCGAHGQLGGVGPWQC